MFNKIKNTHEAIRNDDAAQVRHIGRRKAYYEACTLAVASGSPNALRALLESGEQFYFTTWGTHDADKSAACKLLQAAFSSPKISQLLTVLYDMNKVTGRGRLDESEFFTKDTPIGFIQAQLDKDLTLFRRCLILSLESAENLKIVLSFTSRIHNPQSPLDEALKQVAETGNTEIAGMILERKVNSGVAVGAALLRAATCEQQGMVDAILPYAEPGTCRDIAMQLQSKGVSGAIVSSIEAAAQQKPAVASQPQEAATEGFSRVDDDTLMETKTLPGKGTLTTIFQLSAGVATILHDRGDNTPTGVGSRKFDDYDPEYIQKLHRILDGLNETKTPRSSAYASLPRI